MENSKKKKIILAIISIILLGLCIIVFWWWNENRVRKVIQNSSMKIEDFVEVQKGEGEYTNDTFIIVDIKDVYNWVIEDIKIIPNKYLVFENYKYESEYTYRGETKSRYNFSNAEILLYDLDTKKLSKKVNILPWLKENPNYQIKFGDYYIYSEGVNNDYFIEIGADEKPEIPAEKYAEQDRKIIYYNIEKEKEVDSEGRDDYFKVENSEYYSYMVREKN